MILPWLKERANMWETLCADPGPVWLYGTGNGADQILDRCRTYKIEVAGIFVSDDFARGQVFQGYRVCSCSEVAAAEEPVTILLAFGSEVPEVLAVIKRLAERHRVLAPHLSLFPGDETVSVEWLQRYAPELEKVYGLLADEQSRRVLAGVLNYKLSGKPEYLEAITTERGSDLKALFRFSGDETYLDLGAYHGETVTEFLELCVGRYRRIIAVEPDPKNFRRLVSAVGGLRNTELVQKATWQEEGLLPFQDCGGRQANLNANGRLMVPTISVDDLLAGERADYLKLDVEGAEYGTLIGSRQTLHSYRPKLLLAAYHHDNDLWRLPLLLKQLVPDYRFFLRKHPYLPAWEINYFVVPQEMSGD